MAIIQEEKETKKVILNVSKEVYSLYENNKKMAKELNLHLDFSQDFERWFKKQNEKVKKELEARNKKGVE